MCSLYVECGGSTPLMISFGNESSSLKATLKRRTPETASIQNHGFPRTGKFPCTETFHVSSRSGFSCPKSKLFPCRRIRGKIAWKKNCRKTEQTGRLGK